MVWPKAGRFFTYSVAYIRAPSASPIPRAATMGRMALSDCMMRRKPPPMHLLGADLDVVEDHSAGVDSLHTHLVVDAGTRHADLVGVDDEASDVAVVPRRGVAGLGEDHEPVGLHGPRDPALRAVQARSRPRRRGPSRTRVFMPATSEPAPGSERQNEARWVTRGDTRQITLLLLFGARDHDRSGRQSSEQQHEPEHVRVLGHLFDGEGETQDARSRAAVLLGDAQPQQVGLREFLEDVLGILARSGRSRGRGA